MYQNAIKICFLFFFLAQNAFCQIGQTIEEIKRNQTGEMTEETKDGRKHITFVNFFEDEYGKYESIKRNYFDAEKLCYLYIIIEPVRRINLAISHLDNNFPKNSDMSRWVDEENKLLYFITEEGDSFKVWCMKKY